MENNQNPFIYFIGVRKPFFFLGTCSHVAPDRLTPNLSLCFASRFEDLGISSNGLYALIRNLGLEGL